MEKRSEKCGNSSARMNIEFFVASQMVVLIIAFVQRKPMGFAMLRSFNKEAKMKRTYMNFLYFWPLGLHLSQNLKK